MDTRAYIDALEQTDPLRRSVMRRAIRALGPGAGSRGLDAGCGIGLQATMLSQAVAPGGRVTALDASADMLRHAAARSGAASAGELVSLCRGDIRRLPFAERSFDWVWSADCAGYPVGDLVALLAQLRRVVRPGGKVAILAWSGQSLLPGHAMLEARLNATCSSLIPHLRGVPPAGQFLRALDSFRAVGLADLRARTFVGDIQAPLATGVRDALAALYDMLWGNPTPAASRRDIAQYRRLCLPESQDFIADLQDYYGFFTYTMFRGTVW